jgi:hypothetical protein
VVVREKPKTPWTRQLPRPPASGMRRVLVIAGVYAVVISFVCLINISSALLMAWVLRGASWFSGPGWIVLLICAGSAVWITLYVVGELESWRRVKPRNN